MKGQNTKMDIHSSQDLKSINKYAWLFKKKKCKSRVKKPFYLRGFGLKSGSHRTRMTGFELNLDVCLFFWCLLMLYSPPKGFEN